MYVRGVTHKKKRVLQNTAEHALVEAVRDLRKLESPSRKIWAATGVGA